MARFEESAASVSAQAMDSDAKPKSYAILIMRAVIMILLGSLLAVATWSCFYLARKELVQSLDHMGISYRNEILNRTADSLYAVLDSQRRCALVMSGIMPLFLDGNGEPSDQSMHLAFDISWKTFMNCQNVSGVGVADEMGHFLYLSNIEESSSHYYQEGFIISWTNFSESLGLNSPRYSRIYNMSNGSPLTDAVQVTNATDLHQRSWYKGAKESTDGTTLDLAISSQSQLPILSRGHAVRDHTGQFLGAVGVAVTLTSIGVYMEQLDLKGGHLLLAANGYLMADTVRDYQGPTAGPARLLRPEESRNAVMRAGAGLLDELNDGTRGYYSEATLLGVKYYITVQKIHFERLCMTEVMFVPKVAIMGNLEQDARAAILIIAAVTGGIVLVGFGLVFIFTKPIDRELRLKGKLIAQLEATRRAEVANETKTQFLANVSHDLRTPMASILGLLDILLEEELSSEQASHVQQIKECAVGLLGILNHILDISKIESGNLVLENMEFDLRAQLDSLVETFGVHGSVKRIETGLYLPEDLNLTVKGDQARTRQIFANLLSNAVKFTETGYVALRLTRAETLPVACTVVDMQPSPFTSRSGEQTPQLRLSFEVEDTGCGVPPNKREVVFENFVQADLSTTRVYGGTGLGLGIVRSLVRMMGGDVRFVDKEGPGALLKLDLVVGQVSQSRSGRKSGLVACTGVSVGVVASPGVLTRSLASQYLRDHAVNVVEVSTWKGLLAVLADRGRSKGKLNSLKVPLEGSETPVSPLETACSVDSEAGEVELRPLVQSVQAQQVVKKLTEQREGSTWVLLDILLLGDARQLTPKSLLPQLQELEQALAQRGTYDDRVRIAWLVETSTTSSIRQALREAGYTCLHNKPVSTSKLRRLVSDLIRRESLDAGSRRPSLELGRQASFPSDTEEYSPSPTTVKEQKPLERLRVLVVEDTRVLQKLAVEWLKKLGAETTAVSNGQEAVDAVLGNGEKGSQRFDVVLMDCQMPVMDGYSATRIIKESPIGRHLPIIALTANAMSQDQERCLSVGMDAYFSKPIDRLALEAKILELVQRTEQAPPSGMDR